MRHGKIKRVPSPYRFAKYIYYLDFTGGEFTRSYTKLRDLMTFAKLNDIKIKKYKW